MAAEHLLARGYRKLGLITGPLDWWEARERQLGWQEALIAAGVPFSADQVVEGDWYAASGERGLCQLLEKCPDIEAIFTSNDQMALGLLQAARRLGRKVPEELAVVGFDDIPESAYFCPPLTTVRQELYELGSTAVQAFAHMLEAQRNGNSVDTPQALLIQPQLVIRESSIASNAGKEYNPET